MVLHWKGDHIDFNTFPSKLDSNSSIQFNDKFTLEPTIRIDKNNRYISKMTTFELYGVSS